MRFAAGWLLAVAALVSVGACDKTNKKKDAPSAPPAVGQPNDPAADPPPLGSDLKVDGKNIDEVAKIFGTQGKKSENADSLSYGWVSPEGKKRIEVHFFCHEFWQYECRELTVYWFTTKDLP